MLEIPLYQVFQVRPQICPGKSPFRRNKFDIFRQVPVGPREAGADLETHRGHEPQHRARAPRVDQGARGTPGPTYGGPWGGGMAWENRWEMVV
jgi:hypothetical protein